MSSRICLAAGWMSISLKVTPSLSQSSSAFFFVRSEVAKPGIV